MRAILQSLFLLVCLVVPCLAQETPEWQLFGGYSLQRAGVREYFKTTPIIFTFRNDSVFMNGVEFSATENRNRWFGGTLDFSAYFSTPQVAGISNQERIYSILYGPNFSIPTHGGTAELFHGGNLFAHALFGAAHNSVHVTPTGPHASDFAFNMALGGGFDIPLRTDVSIRVLQVDYMRTTAFSNGRNNFRFSAGVVFNTGKLK
jgi:hypothetical protein